MGGIAAGRLDKRVTIQEETRTSNGQGGWTTGWTALANGEVWAEIVALSGDEAIRAGVERSVQQYRITIRRRDDVTAKHRLERNGVAYNIKSAMPHPKHEDATLIVCETGTAS